MDYTNIDINCAAFGRRLTELLADASMTNTEFARVIGVTKATVSKYRDGSILPSVGLLYTTARYFGVSLDYLLGLSEVRSPEAMTRFVSEDLNIDEEAYQSLKRVLLPSRHSADDDTAPEEEGDIFSIEPPLNPDYPNSVAVQTILPARSTIMRMLLRNEDFFDFIDQLRYSIGGVVTLDVLRQFNKVYSYEQLKNELFYSKRAVSADKFDSFEILSKVTQGIALEYKKAHQSEIDAAMERYRKTVNEYT